MDTPHTTTTTTTTTTTATRPHYNYSPHPYNGREDCWSESATAVLIKAWGDRYLHLNRGNLRQKDWKDVADAVNSSVSVKTPKTDVQCKNRIDTIKKKYKQEKSKLPLPSKWPFYSHLDSLIGATTTPPVKHKSSSSSLSLHKLPSVTFTVKPYRQKLNPKPNSGGGSSSKSRINNSSNGSTGSSRSHGAEEDGDDGDANDDDDEEDDDDDTVFDEDHARKHRMVQDSSDGAAFRELARAILKFGEVYERIESSKQQQMMELEKQRMEFTKDLEFQRMQMFMEAQLELEKIKRPKYSSGTGKKL